MLIFCLAACGKQNPDSGTGGSQQSAPEPTAVINPNELEWGYEATGSSDTQHWYAGGVKSQSDYVFFDDYTLTVVKGGETSEISVSVKDKQAYP